VSEKSVALSRKDGVGGLDGWVDGRMGKISLYEVCEFKAQLLGMLNYFEFTFFTL
jgi:hypothetical protein